MPFNKASSAQGAPSKASSGDKSKAAPAVNHLAKQPDKKPAVVTPAPRS